MRSHLQTSVVLLAFILSVSALEHAQAEDASGWRGPTREGVASAFEPPSTWPKSLKKVWQVEVGVGHASPVVVGNHIFQFSRQDEKEVLRCLDLSGKEVWQHAYPAPYKMNNAARGHGKGPKSTPWVSGGRVFTLGIDGIFQCRRTSDGELLWEAHDSLPKGSPLYGAATSPLVSESDCLIHLGKHNAGALVAFDVESGKPRWRWNEDGPAYTSPVVMRFAEKRQYVTQSQRFCLSFSEDGALLWKIPFKTGYDQNSVTPLQHNDTIVFSGYRKGVSSYRPEQSGGRWSVDEVWHTDDVSMYMSSPVAVGDRLFGFSERNKGQLFCLNANDGTTVWLGPPRQGENASLWVVGGHVAALMTDGRLIVFNAQADALQVVAEYTVADSPIWAHPALFGKQILVKDETRLTMWSLQ